MKNKRVCVWILGLMWVAGLGCDDPDAQTASDPAENAENCSEDEWWCVGEMNNMSNAATNNATDPNNAKAPNNGKAPNNDKDPGTAKEFTGWYGQMQGEEGTLGFSRYVDAEPTCLLSYPILDPVDLSDCEECEFAYQATLGEVEVTTDEGGCGEAGELGGTTVHFGHGLEGLGADARQLYWKQDDVWTPVPVGSSVFDVEKEYWYFFYPPVGEMAPGGEASGFYYEIELDTDTGEGVHEAYVIGADGESTVCAVSYRIAGAIETECPSCLFAWTMPLSDEEVRLEGVECAKFVGLNDTSLVFGHAESDQLMVQKSGVWIETPGKSETSGSAWTISIFVAPM